MSETAEILAGQFDDEGLIYTYRPKIVGVPNAFRLGGDSLEWDLGGFIGKAPYANIAKVRMGFKPSNFSNRRYTAEVWLRSGLKLEIPSVSYKSMVAMQDQGQEFRIFIGALHRHIVASGGDCRFEAGFAPWHWWALVVCGVGISAAVLYMGALALGEGDWMFMLLIGVFTAVFGWQVLPMITRNRPAAYDPRKIPEHILPALPSGSKLFG